MKVAPVDPKFQGKPWRQFPAGTVLRYSQTNSYYLRVIGGLVNLSNNAYKADKLPNGMPSPIRSQSSDYYRVDSVTLYSEELP